MDISLNLTDGQIISLNGEIYDYLKTNYSIEMDICNDKKYLVKDKKTGKCLLILLAQPNRDFLVLI